MVLPSLPCASGVIQHMVLSTCTSWLLLRQAPGPLHKPVHACPAAVASQAAASVVDEVLQAGIETSSDARSVSEAQYSDDFESLGRKTPSRTGEVLL